MIAYSYLITPHYMPVGARAAMVAKGGGVFGTLTYPHLIRPYLGYYGYLQLHVASHYIWGSLVSPYTLFVQLKAFTGT